MPVFIFTTFEDPSATIGTFGNGLNDAGQIVGNITNSSGNHGFLLSGGTYTPIDHPSANNQTFAEGVNDAGQIAGYYRIAIRIAHAFLDSGGTYTTLDDPSATNGTFAEGVNDAGQIVGYYQTATGTGFHVFLAIPHNPPPPGGTTAL